MLTSNLALQDDLSANSQLVAVPTKLFKKETTKRLAGPRVIDLFAGAGGFSLGFSFAGCKISAAVEMDEWACDTLRANHTGTKIVQENISSLSTDQLFELGGKADLIIGGPPCQGFSVANIRAKDPTDPRNTLFEEFIRTVEVCNPKAFLLENVPGLLRRRTRGGEDVIQVIQSEIRRIGYIPHVQVLHAVDYGVPQIRPRLFVLGLKKQSKNPFPGPTHSYEDGMLFDSHKGQKAPVTLWQAISDLPKLEAREGLEELEYLTVPQNDFQLLLRAGSDKLFNHQAMRHSPRLVERFSKLKWGQSGADAPAEHGARLRGKPDQLSGKSYDQNNRRMFPDRPCHTIPASFYANFVHPYQHRNFTPREGARLQTFPDWYRFMGKPTVISQKMLAREGRNSELHLCQYNQIGNAVPPLLAYHLASHLTNLI